MSTVKKQHYIPNSFIKRVMGVKSESIFYFKEGEWFTKKTKNIHTISSFYTLTDETASKLFNGDVMALENHFSIFEDNLSRTIDSFSGTVPFERAALQLKMVHNFQLRDPLYSNIEKIKMNEPLKNEDGTSMSAEQAMVYLKKMTSLNKDKFSGDSILKKVLIRYFLRRYSPKIRESFPQEFLFNKVVILNFEEELPFLNLSWQHLSIFKKGNKSKETIWRNTFPDYKVLQITTNQWYIILNEQSSHFTNPFDRSVNYKPKKETEIYSTFKEINVPANIARKIRYALISGGCFSRLKNCGEENDDFFFDSSYTSNSTGGEKFGASFEINDLFINAVKNSPEKWTNIFSGEFGERMEMINKDELKLIDDIGIDKVIDFIK